MNGKDHKPSMGANQSHVPWAWILYTLRRSIPELNDSRSLSHTTWDCKYHFLRWPAACDSLFIAIANLKNYDIYQKESEALDWMNSNNLFQTSDYI